MKEYIFNIEFGTWKNQLWFMCTDDCETKEKWKDAIKKIELSKDLYKDAMKFQNESIEYLKSLGFIRIQK